MIAVAFDLNRSEDQRHILDAAAAMLSTSFPLERLRGGERDNLAPLASFGAFALTLSEKNGGAGLTLVEEALLHRLFGRHLLSTRAVATATAAVLAREIDRPELAAGLIAGDTEACAALWTGDETLVIDGDRATLAVLFHNASASLLDIGGAQRQAAVGLGHTIPIARIVNERLTIVGESKVDRVVAFADLLISAQLLGVAEVARDLAVEYAKLRRQFGKPIGAFQAIKHRCANMAIAAEMLSAQLDMAAIALRDGGADAGFQVAALRRLAPGVALANARACIQIHGGIGFSDESDAHRILKQAHILARLGGGAPMLSFQSPMAPHIPIDGRT